MIKSFIRKIRTSIRKVFFKHGRISYSQGGEDLILDCIFNSAVKGFYVDIGANHPTKASNTYFFYKKGWTGVNIDAFPDAVKKFKLKRYRDINIQVGVSDVESSLNFYSFKRSSFNTFNEKIVDDIKKVTTLNNIEQIKVKPLKLILDQHNIKSIDFMSVDVEGLDLNVIKSNDWEKYRPKVVLIEEFMHGIDIKQSPIYEYMETIGYMYFCQTCTNAFYLEKDFYKQRFVVNKI